MTHREPVPAFVVAHGAHGSIVSDGTDHDTLNRVSELRRTKSGLSRDASQRAVQLYIVAFMGCAIVALLVLAVPLLKEIVATDPSGDNAPRNTVGHVALRSGFGIAAAVISVALPVLTWRFRQAITHVATVRGTYLTAAVVTLLAPVPGMLFWARTGLVASLMGLVALVLALAIRRVPAADQVTPSDFRGIATGREDDPEHWVTRSGWVDHPVRSVVLVILAVFVLMAVFAGIAMALL